MKPAGYWFIGCDSEIRDSDGLTELDRVWTAVEELVEEKVFIQATYRKSSFPSVVGSTIFTGVVINCFVENYLDIEEVIRSAVEFRKKVYYPHPLYMKTTYQVAPGKLEHLHQYLHCFDGDFYNFFSKNTGTGFRLIKKNSST